MTTNNTSHQQQNQNPHHTKPKVVVRAASKEQQVLRQKKVTSLQHRNAKKAKQTSSQYYAQLPPHMSPIEDKYIFGLANNANTNTNPNTNGIDTNADGSTVDAHNNKTKSTEEEIEAEETDNCSFDPQLRYAPLDYKAAFDTKEFLHTTRGKFCCYTAGFLDDPELVFVCLHGAGHCALSWAAVCQLIKTHYQVFTFDYRAHGETEVEDEYAMSKENLVLDIIEVIRSKYGANGPPIVLVGHSLGGALAVHVAHAHQQTQPPVNNNNTSTSTRALPQIVGIVVVDLVEGTALNSLKFMPNIIRRRPQSFKSLTNAIKYCVTSGIIHNRQSAKMSVPPMFRRTCIRPSSSSSMSSSSVSAQQTNATTTTTSTLDGIHESESDIMNANHSQPKHATSIAQILENGGIVENDHNNNSFSNNISSAHSSELSQNNAYVWRTDVLRTQEYWRSWFVGLSDLFLKAPVAKMLMIADTDRLDKPLTIGQMQGKYELSVMGCGVGHTVHEDAPHKVAEKLLHFAQRNQFVKMWTLNHP